MATTVPAGMGQWRRTAAQRVAENPVLRAGEMGVETSSTYQPVFKIGDGTTAYNSMDWFIPNGVNRLSIGPKITGTATASSISEWGSFLLANATTGGMSFSVSFPSTWTTASLTWGYVPVTGGSNVRWSATITRVNALGFTDLVTDAPQVTDTFTQAMGTTNQIEHVFSHPTTFDVHNSDAVLGEVVKMKIERIGGDAADTSTSDLHLINFSISRLS